MPPEATKNTSETRTRADESIPDPARSIALVRGQAVGYARAPGHIQLAQISLMYGLLGSTFGAFGLLRNVASSLSLPGSLLIVAIGVALLVGAVVLTRWLLRRSTNEGLAIGKLPPYEPGDTSRRIKVIVGPAHAVEMLRTLDGARHGFEPEIARVPLAVGLDPQARRLAWLGGALGLVLGVAFVLAMQYRMSEMTLTIWFLMGTTALGAVGVPEFFFPTYVRVMPGRLDVLRHRSGGGAMRTVQSFDLRTRPLLLAGPVVFIEPREPGQPRPEKVRSKRWPYTLMYAEPFTPEAVSLSLTAARKRLWLATIWGATTEGADAGRAGR